MSIGKELFYSLPIPKIEIIIPTTYTVGSTILCWPHVMWNEEKKCVAEFRYGNPDLKTFSDGLALQDKLVIVFNNSDQSQMLFAFRQWFRDHVLFGFFENGAQTFFYTFERNLLAVKFVPRKCYCTLIQSFTFCLKCLFQSNSTIPKLSYLLQWGFSDVMWSKKNINKKLPTGKDKKEMKVNKTHMERLLSELKMYMCVYVNHHPDRNVGSANLWHNYGSKFAFHGLLFPLPAHFPTSSNLLS